MTHDYKARIDEINEYALKLKELVPDVTSAFGRLSHASHAEGALDKKTKELIALAISVSRQCDGCIAYHARNLHRAGGSRQEAAEALGVAIQLGGGPAVNSAADALRAFDQFAEDS